MAEVTLGIGSSHSPMLSTPYEAFAGLADLDRARVGDFDVKARENAAWIGRELRAEGCVAEAHSALEALDKLEQERLRVLRQLWARGAPIPVPRPPLRDPRPRQGGPTCWHATTTSE